MIRKTLLGALLLLACISVHAQTNLVVSPASDQEVVFKNGEAGYFVFLIPAIVTTNDGTLLAFSEGRIDARSDKATAHVVMKSSKDQGKTWSKLSLVYSEGAKRVQNIAPVVDKDTGTIWLFFTIDSVGISLTSSTDGGQTWAPPTAMSAQLRNALQTGPFSPGPGHGIQLTQGEHKGRLLVTAYASQLETPTTSKGNKSLAIYSDDHGKTWKSGTPTEREGEGRPDGNECMAAQLADGNLYMTIRNNTAKGGRGYAISKDGGASWSKIHLQHDLPEPVCQASVMRFTLPDGSPICVYVGPSVTAENRKDKAARQKLSLWTSQDNATTWTFQTRIYPGISAYSDMTITKDGQLGILFNADNTLQDRTLFGRYTITPAQDKEKAAKK